MKRLLLICLLSLIACRDDDGPTPPPPDPPPPPPMEEISDKTISWFLWKPSSERDGNLVILVDPEKIDVVVEKADGSRHTGHDFGPSNGRGTTSRFSKPGCWFGHNVKVYHYDREDGGSLVLTKSGARSKDLADGCKRYDQDFR